MALYAQQPISGNNKSTNFSSENNYANEFFKDFNDTTYELDNEGNIILEETSPGYFNNNIDEKITTLSELEQALRDRTLSRDEIYSQTDTGVLENYVASRKDSPFAGDYERTINQIQDVLDARQQLESTGVSGNTSEILASTYSLNLRENPSNTGKIITELKDGSQVKILNNDASSKYVEVEVNGQKGYVVRNALNMADDKTTGTVKVSQVTLGPKAGTAGWEAIHGTLPLGRENAYLNAEKNVSPKDIYNEMLSNGSMSKDEYNDAMKSIDKQFMPIPEDEVIDISADKNAVGDLTNIQSTIGAGVLSALTTFGNFVGSLKKYDSDEVSIVKSKIQSVNGDVEEVHRSIISATGSLSFNELTQSKLPGNGVLMTGLYTLEGNWRTSVEAILSDVGASETAVANTDKNDGGSTSGKNYGTFAASAVGGSTSSSGGTKHRQVKEEKPKPTEPINTELIAASVGIVTFTEIVAMKESMDATTTVNSSESASYGLIGVTKDNNEQYYYQIIDKETGKVYYIEVNDKVKVETEVKEALKVNEDLALLKTNNTDAEDNLGKIAKQGEMYLVKSTEENADGISFAKVLDPSDGKDYYVMVNDETEIISLDNLNGVEAAAGAVSEDGGIDVTK